MPYAVDNFRHSQATGFVKRKRKRLSKVKTSFDDRRPDLDSPSKTDIQFRRNTESSQALPNESKN